jgi:hypothetical protein
VIAAIIAGPLTALVTAWTQSSVHAQEIYAKEKLAALRPLNTALYAMHDAISPGIYSKPFGSDYSVIAQNLNNALGALKALTIEASPYISKTTKKQLDETYNQCARASSPIHTRALTGNTQLPDNFHEEHLLPTLASITASVTVLEIEFQPSNLTHRTVGSKRTR